MSRMRVPVFGFQIVTIPASFELKSSSPECEKETECTSTAPVRNSDTRFPSRVFEIRTNPGIETNRNLFVID